VVRLTRGPGAESNSSRNVTGVLVVDKPAGKTSHDVVLQARRLFKERSVGHAGTLDPLATGVLLLLFGEATKLSAYLAADDKSYQALIRFGSATETLDADGRVVEQCAILPGHLRDADLENALALECARTEQVPPAVSALKVQGTRAYRLSRRGEPVTLAPRPVRVSALELIARGPDWIRVALSVSKGYYVRSLARDVGQRLGLPAHIEELRRTASGAFRLDEAVAWPPQAPSPLLPVGTAAARSLPVLELTEEGAERARQGKELLHTHFTAASSASEAGYRPHAWLDRAGALVAVGHRVNDAHVVLRGFRAH
jgi:tRNA pseudouridine55 synthase